MLSAHAQPTPPWKKVADQDTTHLKGRGTAPRTPFGKIGYHSEIDSEEINSAEDFPRKWNSQSPSEASDEDSAFMEKFNDCEICKDSQVGNEIKDALTSVLNTLKKHRVTHMHGCNFETYQKPREQKPKQPRADGTVSRSQERISHYSKTTEGAQPGFRKRCASIRARFLLPDASPLPFLLVFCFCFLLLRLC